MVDAPATPPATPPAPPPATPPAQPWHHGVEAETVGFWQNKGLDLTDPVKFATGFTKQYRDMEAFRGVPANELLRIPKPDAPEADVKTFWNKLGAPGDPKEYDFAGIKYADGTDLEPAFAEAIRATAARLHMPKGWAAEIAKDMAKFADGDQATAAAEKTASINAEKAALLKEWGPQEHDAKLFVAKQGAKVLGLTPDQVDALEGMVGYKAVMVAMHRVGVLNKEDRFIAGGGGTGGAMTREQAINRKADLMKDTGWTQRYMSGGTTERTEMLNLNRIITGDFESAA